MNNSIKGKTPKKNNKRIKKNKTMDLSPKQSNAAKKRIVKRNRKQRIQELKLKETMKATENNDPTVTL